MFVNSLVAVGGKTLRLLVRRAYDVKPRLNRIHWDAGVSAVKTRQDGEDFRWVILIKRWKRSDVNFQATALPLGDL